MQQKLIVTNFGNLEQDVKSHLNKGWVVRQILSEVVASSYGMARVEGRVAVLFEGKPKDE